MMLNLVKVQKVEVEEEIIEVEVEEIKKEEDVANSTNEEITTSYHIIKEEVKTILVLPIGEEDVIHHGCSMLIDKNGRFIGKCPTKSVCDKTPKEAWGGKRPSIRHLRVFGCIAYAHVLDQLKKKLDDKGEMCIFIGYSTNSKAYKLYNPKTKKFQKEKLLILDNYEEHERHMDSILDEPKSSNRPQRHHQLPTKLQDYVVGNDNDPSE
ncbi:hypothetical protein CR513_12928, partial [Mucuna pruriens]